MNHSASLISFVHGRELGNGYRLMNKDAGRIIADEKASKPVINEPCKLSGLTRSTFVLSTSPDGLKVASTHGDHSVRVTETATGRCLHVLTGHPRTPWSATFHPTSNDILASGCLDGDVRIWDLNGHGSEKWRSPRGSVITSLAFHPTEQVLVIATNNIIYFWDWSESQPFALSKTGSEYEKVRWVQFDPLGHFLYTGIANCLSREELDSTFGRNPSWSTMSALNQIEQVHLRRRYLDVMDRYSNYLQHQQQNPEEPFRENRTQSNHASERNLVNRQSQMSNMSPVVEETLPVSEQSGAVNDEPLTDIEGPDESVIADIDIVQPRSPAQVDALDSARMYAANVTHHVTRMIQNAQDFTARIHVNARNVTASHRPSSPTSGTIPLDNALETERQSNSQINVWSVRQSSETGDGTVQHNTTDGDTVGIQLSNNVNQSSEQNIVSEHDIISSSNILVSNPDDGLSNSANDNSCITRPNNERVDSVLAAPSANSSENFSHSLLRSRLTEEARTTARPVDLNRGHIANPGFRPWRNRLAAVERRRNAHNNNTTTAHSLRDNCEWCRSSQSVLHNRSSIPRRDLRFAMRRLRHCNHRSGQNVSNHGTQTTKQAEKRLVLPDDEQLENIAKRQLDATRTVKARCAKVQEWLASNYACITDHPSDNIEINSSHNEPNEPIAGCSGELVSGPKNKRLKLMTQMLTMDDSDTDDEELDGAKSVKSETKTVTVKQPLIRDIKLPYSKKGKRLLKSEKNPLLHSMLLDPVPDSPESDSQLEEIRNRESAARHVDVIKHSSNGSPLQNLQNSSQEPESDRTDRNEEIASFEKSSTSHTECASQESPPLLSDEPPSNHDTVRPIRRESGFQSEFARMVDHLTPQSFEFSSNAVPTSSATSGTSTTSVSHSHMWRLNSDLSRQSQSERMLQMIRRCRNQRIQRIVSRYRAQGNDGSEFSALRQRLRSQRQDRHLSRYHVYNSSQENPHAPIPDIQITAPTDSPPELIGRFEARRRELLEFDERVPLLPREERVLQRQLLQRHLLHPHYAVSILDDAINRPSDSIQSAINRAIAGAFMSTGEPAVASNIVNLTHRIQRWDFRNHEIPNISEADANIIVPHCKLHNDASSDISSDGSFLSTFVPSHGGFPDSFILAVYSLQSHELARCLYTKSFGPNAISVSISPTNRYVLVGLAAKRLSWVFSPHQLVAQVYELVKEEAGESSMQHIIDVIHPCNGEMLSHISLNSAKWLKGPGEGIVYGTNRGGLHICRPGMKGPQIKKGEDEEDLEDIQPVRRNLMAMFLGFPLTRTSSMSTQTQPTRQRTASTQTPANMYYHL